MTETLLREAFDDLAAQAKYYDVADKALRVGRRRRRLAAMAPVAVAAAVVLGIAVASLPLQRPAPPGNAAGGPAGPAAPGAAPTGPAETDVRAETPPPGWLPSRVDIPPQVPPALPTDRGVGPGVLTYTRPGATKTAEERVTLVAADAKQYLVAAGPDYSLGVSPDGRWLLLRRGDKSVLRDLVRGTERPAGDAVPSFLAWSADGRWLVIQTEHVVAAVKGGGEQKPKTTIHDLVGGDSSTVPLGQFPNAVLVGVLPSGDLVISGSRQTTVELWFVDRAGQQRRHVRWDVAAALRDREKGASSMLSHNGVRLTNDGRSALLQPAIPISSPTLVDPGSVGDDILAVDLTTGKTRRYELPDPTGNPARRIMGVAPGGVIIGDTRDTGVAALEWLDLGTGKLRSHTRFSGFVTQKGSFHVRGE